MTTDEGCLNKLQGIQGSSVGTRLARSAGDMVKEDEGGKDEGLICVVLTM